VIERVTALLARHWCMQVSAWFTVTPENIEPGGGGQALSVRQRRHRDAR
jgi:hypothetical protein